ncbi:MAG: hypothetical protein LBU37_09010, partial [Tannerellaceae bacterium]|nr:hypothetical protein [Tannerellaceae bacterium]
MKKHGFKASDIKNLPKALSDPVAVFKGSVPGSFAILTELSINGNNVLVSLGIGKGTDVDFNIISSAYGKSNEGIVSWINNGKLLSANKEEALDYLRISAPIAEAQNNSELNSVTKIVQDFENPKLSSESSHISDKPRLQTAQDTELEAINNQFNAELQQQIDGTLPKGHNYKLGNAGEILQSALIPNLPIELQASRLNDKSMQENHPFDLSEVKDLPKAIQHPLAVFRSATHIGSFVIMTEIEHKGKNFVVALQANKKKGSIEINDIRSVYPKNNGQVANWIDEGLLEYADKQKMVEWFSKQRSNSAEVRKLFNRTAKIVQDFKNPKLSSESSHISDKRMSTIDRETWEKLIKWLKKTKLARNVFIDEASMREYLETHLGKKGAERFMTAWHGTAADFSRFQKEFMLTGEGAMLYGVGFYFTDKRSIAEAYAKNRPYTADNKVAAAANDLLVYNNNDEKLVLEILKLQGYAPEFEKQVEEFIKNRSGYLLKIKIHGEKTIDELNFIRYDKPLTASQRGSILKELNKIRDEKNENYYSAKTVVEGDTYDGNNVYQYLSGFLGSDIAASEFLLRAGIDGIQYPTEYTSKRAHEESYNYVVFDENAIEITDKIRFMSTPKGKVYGFVTPEGDIYLDPNLMNANTPIHEFGHLWNTFIRKYNKPLWKKGIELAKQSSYWKEVSENPEAFALKENAAEADIADEVLARMIGDKGADVFKEKGLGEKLRAWLNEVWEWIGSRLGIRGLTAEQIQNLT